MLGLLNQLQLLTCEVIVAAVEYTTELRSSLRPRTNEPTCISAGRTCRFRIRYRRFRKGITKLLFLGIIEGRFEDGSTGVLNSL
jgi:hypothetical protein